MILPTVPRDNQTLLHARGRREQRPCHGASRPCRAALRYVITGAGKGATTCHTSPARAPLALAAVHADAATLSAPERTRREQDQVRHLRRLRSEHRLRVRAGYVALLDGTPLFVDAAQAAHAAWVTQQQQRRAHRPPAPGDPAASMGST